MTLQPADQLLWFHLVTPLTRIDEPQAREWYAVQAAKHGWSQSTPEVSLPSIAEIEAELGGEPKGKSIDNE